MSRITPRLADHPRAVSALFTVTLLLSFAAPVIAGGGGGTSGP